MGGTDGFETTKVLKCTNNTKHIPVIIFSALHREVDRTMALEAGADGYVIKPFNSKNLIQEISKFV
jgi:two-component system cell cycle response regulator